MFRKPLYGDPFAWAASAAKTDDLGVLACVHIDQDGRRLAATNMHVLHIATVSEEQTGLGSGLWHAKTRQRYHDDVSAKYPDFERLITRREGGTTWALDDVDKLEELLGLLYAREVYSQVRGDRTCATYSVQLSEKVAVNPAYLLTALAGFRWARIGWRLPIYFTLQGAAQPVFVASETGDRQAVIMPVRASISDPRWDLSDLFAETETKVEDDGRPLALVEAPND